MSSAHVAQDFEIEQQVGALSYRHFVWGWMDFVKVILRLIKVFVVSSEKWSWLSAW